MTFPVAQLRRAFRVVNGGTPTSDPENWDGEILWATPVDLGSVNGGVLDATTRTLSDVGLASGSGAVPAGSLIVSTRAPIGYVSEVVAKTAFNQGCRGLVPTQPLDVRYFRYQLVSMSEVLQSRGQGSTFLELSSEALAATPVHSPSLATQRTITDYPDTETVRIDALIESKQTMVELAEERYRSSLSHRIDGAADHHAALGRFVRSITQGVSPQAENYPAQDDEWGLLKLSAVKFGAFIPTENKRLPADYPIDLNLQPQPGDLLVTRSNTPAYVGDACAVTGESGKVLLCDLIYRLRLDARVLPEFAAASLLTHHARWHLSGAARGTSQSMVKLRGEDVKATPIPVLDIRGQELLLDSIRQEKRLRDELQAAISQQLSGLKEHRQALIAAAVTGELKIPEAAA